MNTAQFKELITTTIIQPNYIEEISTFILGRNRWRSIGMFFETLSKVCIGSGSVLSFSSGVYNSTNMSFVAGSVSTLSLVFLQFSSFCYTESKKSTEGLNILLKKLELDTLPQFIETHTDMNHKNSSDDDDDHKDDVIPSPTILEPTSYVSISIPDPIKM